MLVPAVEAEPGFKVPPLATWTLPPMLALVPVVVPVRVAPLATLTRPKPVAGLEEPARKIRCSGLAGPEKADTGKLGSMPTWLLSGIVYAVPAVLAVPLILRPKPKVPVQPLPATAPAPPPPLAK